MEDARETLFRAEDYMNGLGDAFDTLTRKKLSDAAVEEYISMLLPIADDASETTERNVKNFAIHVKPLGETKNYRENLFAKTMDGNPLTDKAYQIVMAA